MGLKMASPVKIGSTYYLRVAVPVELSKKVKGFKVSLPILGVMREVTIKDHVKVSLRTKDEREAKIRFNAANVVLDTFWEAARRGPKEISHKEALSYAGKIRQIFVDAFDENPASPELWRAVQEVNAATQSEAVQSLMIARKGQTQAVAALESRFGKIMDAFLRSHGILLSPKSRPLLLKFVAKAMDDAARVNEAKADGDYGFMGEASRYPVFVAPKTILKTEPKEETLKVAFGDVVDKWVLSQAKGRDAVPVRKDTEKKFRLACREFAEFRGSDIVATVTGREGEAWKLAMLEEQRLGNNSIKQRVQNVRTVIKKARKQSFGELFPDGNPFDFVELPDVAEVDSDLKTFTIDEARKILLAARMETKPQLRWLPWLCAYSGSRINEVAQLNSENFFQVGDDWFYRITTMGGKKVKNRSSVRRVPVHPDLIDEGLLDFVATQKTSARMFPARSAIDVGTWVRHTVGIVREEVMPNHGWRHLFEDQAMNNGMQDDAKRYITGRSGGGSAAGYGNSDVMLPGLAVEMRKIQSFLVT
jgi:integrase